MLITWPWRLPGPCFTHPSNLPPPRLCIALQHIALAIGEEVTLQTRLLDDLEVRSGGGGGQALGVCTGRPRCQSHAAGARSNSHFQV